MLPDRVSNPEPMTSSQVPYRLRYAARLQDDERMVMKGWGQLEPHLRLERFSSPAGLRA